jgi:hypothetical protein
MFYTLKSDVFILNRILLVSAISNPVPDWGSRKFCDRMSETGGFYRESKL